MVAVVDFASEAQRRVLIDDSMALMADELAVGFCFCVAFAALCLVLVLHETDVGEFGAAGRAFEALWVPVVGHGFDDAADDEFTAALAAGSVQDVEIALTVLAAAVFVVDAVLELAEALRATRKEKVNQLGAFNQP